jgi:UDP-galactopyranose mutase
VVGAGFAGSVLAERLASQHDARVLVIDKRPHLPATPMTITTRAGILIHQYGPHIFHANSDEIVDYLSQFTPLAPLRAPRARRGARQAGADPDQPDDAERAVRPRSQDRRGRGRAIWRPRAEPVEDIKTSKTSLSTPSGASSTSCSSRAIPASNGAWIRASSTRW